MTKAGQQPSRREVRHTQAQHRHVIRFAVLGVLAVVVIAAAVVVFVMNGTERGTKAGATIWSSASYSGGPRLAVDRTLVDAGPVAYGQKVSARYRLKNVGDQPLTMRAPTVDILEGC